jgi:hypothetical protein
MSNYLTLPVSIGEGLDKLSILEIKLEYINDKRKDNVKKEYNILYDKMKVYLLYPSIDNYYKMLKKTNLYIWKLMDILRDDKDIDDNRFNYISKETIIGNDVRYRIKSKINNIINSYVKEEKGYKITRIIIDISDYNEELDVIFKPLYYFSITYDEIYLVTKNISHKRHIDIEFSCQINIIEEIPDNLDYGRIFELNDDIKRENNNDIYEVFKLSEELVNKYI